MTAERITTAAELNALPVGSVVETTWRVRDPLTGVLRGPYSRLMFVTEHMLIAERREIAKADAVGCFDSITVVSRPDADRVIEVHHHDIEKHAEHFNEGYETAVAQGLADDPTLAQDWMAGRLAEAEARSARAALQGAAQRALDAGFGEVMAEWLIDLARAEQAGVSRG